MPASRVLQPENRITSRNSGMSGYLRPWRSPAAKFILLKHSAGLTGNSVSLSVSMPQATETRKAHQRSLAADILRSGGSVRLQALGTSMLPSIWPGDLLVIDGNPQGHVIMGDLALVAGENRFFVHRVVGEQKAQGQVRWITRGDILSADDPPVSASELLGRVSAIHRNGRVTIPSRRLSLPRRVLARVLGHYTSFRSLALRLHAIRCTAVASSDE